MQKIRMMGNGPNGNHFAGKEIEVDDARAALLIEGKHAIFAYTPQATETAVETKSITETLP